MIGILLLATNAFAWNHTGWYWPDDELPIQWWFDDDTIEDSLIGMTEDVYTADAAAGEHACTDTTGDPDADCQITVIQTSWDNWPQHAPCAGLSNEFQGIERLDQLDGDDGKTTIMWEDPDDIQDAGVLGVTYTSVTGGDARTANGRVYYSVRDSDIVFNNDVDFGYSEDILAGTCLSESSIESVATHEIGHLLGLAHSCEEGDGCTEIDLAEATMNWTIGPCDLGGSDLNIDDISSIYALYGVYGTFTATSATSGAAPFTVTFEVESEAEVASVHWQWGDGTEEDGGRTASHEYTTSGSFTVRATMDLVDPECGTTTYEQTEIGYVLACTAPVPEDGAGGFFELNVEDGLVWRTVNRTDMSTYGCVDTVTWEVYEGSEVNPERLVDFNGDGAGDRIGAWAPQIAFPSSGTYTVQMNVGGPGGIVGSTLTIDVSQSSSATGGCAGCATPSPVALAGAALAGLAAMARRRSG